MKRREFITGALRWSEIHDDRIELQGDRTKNGEQHTVPLCDAAIDLVQSLPRIGKVQLVFSTTGDTSVSGWSRAKTTLDKHIAELSGGPLHCWRLHDLRRTVATGLQRLEVSLQVVESVLGHVSGSRAGIVGVYQRHTFDPEKRAAIDA